MYVSVVYVYGCVLCTHVWGECENMFMHMKSLEVSVGHLPLYFINS